MYNNEKSNMVFKKVLIDEKFTSETDLKRPIIKTYDGKITLEISCVIVCLINISKDPVYRED